MKEMTRILGIVMVILGSRGQSGAQCCGGGDSKDLASGGERVSVLVTGCIEGDYSVSLNGPGGAELDSSTKEDTTGCGFQTFEKLFGQLDMDTEYEIRMVAEEPAAKSTSWEILVDGPDCGVIELDGEQRTTLSFGDASANCHSAGKFEQTVSLLIRSTGSDTEMGSTTGVEETARRLSMSLGPEQPDGEPVGSLSLNLESTLDSQGDDFTILSYSAASLKFTTNSNFSEELGSLSGAKWQLKMNHGMAQMDDGINTYTLKFYEAADVGAKSGTFYTTTSSPVVTYTIGKPSGHTGWKQLQFTEDRDGVTREQTIELLAANQWKVTEKGNVRVTTITRVPGGVPVGTTMTETVLVQNATSGDLSKTVTLYENFAWGYSATSIKRHTDSTNVLETVYDYHQGSRSAVSYGRLKSWKDMSTGHWFFFHYDDGTFDLGPSKVYQRWKNDPPDDPAMASDTNSHMTRYQYTWHGTVDR